MAELAQWDFMWRGDSSDDESTSSDGAGSFSGGSTTEGMESSDDLLGDYEAVVRKEENGIWGASPSGMHSMYDGSGGDESNEWEDGIATEMWPTAGLVDPLMGGAAAAPWESAALALSGMPPAMLLAMPPGMLRPGMPPAEAPWNEPALKFTKIKPSAPPAAIVPQVQWPRAPAATVAVMAPATAPINQQSDRVPPPLVCPFCAASPEVAIQFGECGEDADSKRRSRRERKQPRANFKLGQWWKGFGYSGPRYCQRCSEVFRDHLIRQQSNSAGCTRAEPCNDCGKVLAQFKDKDPWGKIDAREEANRLKRKQRQSKAGLGGPADPKKSKVAGAAVATLAACSIALLALHPELIQSPAVATASVNCAAMMPQAPNAQPADCAAGPVGSMCGFWCEPIDIIFTGRIIISREESSISIEESSFSIE